ncbi:MAG: hypothetical protein ACYTXR_06425, partial [Nostoc sp.]
EFIGKLKDEDKNPLDPLVLDKTKYLPNLEGKKWEDPYDIPNSLTQVQRLLIKRAKIDATILLKESVVAIIDNFRNQIDNCASTKQYYCPSTFISLL